MGRVSTGVRGMTIDGGDDEVVGMICMEPETQNTVLVISENGYGKRSLLDAYRITNRGAKGVKTINVTEKVGKLVGILSVNDDNDIMIINKSGITLRIKASAIRVMGRAAQGVRLINLGRRNDSIASVCCVASDPDEEVDNEMIESQTEIIEEVINEPDVEEQTDDNIEELDNDSEIDGIPTIGDLD